MLTQNQKLANLLTKGFNFFDAFDPHSFSETKRDDSVFANIPRDGDIYQRFTDKLDFTDGVAKLIRRGDVFQGLDFSSSGSSGSCGYVPTIVYLSFDGCKDIPLYTVNGKLEIPGFWIYLVAAHYTDITFRVPSRRTFSCMAMYGNLEHRWRRLAASKRSTTTWKQGLHLHQLLHSGGCLYDVGGLRAKL